MTTGYKTTSPTDTTGRTLDYVIRFAPGDEKWLITAALEAKVSVAQFVHDRALDAIRNETRTIENRRGRVDTIALKVTRLHRAGYTDKEIGGALGMTAGQVGDKRRELKLPSHTPEPAPLKKWRATP